MTIKFKYEDSEAPQPLVAAPTVEHHPTGFGIGHSRPRLSWRFESPEAHLKNWNQTGYDIEITTHDPEETEIFHKQSSNSVLVPWPGQELRSRAIVHVRVRCHGKREGATKTSATSWSSKTKVETALLEACDWSATWITSSAGNAESTDSLRPLRFRKLFILPTAVIASARLYITSLGVYEAYLNGMRIGDQVMAPGWTSYNHRLHYQTFNLAEHNVLRTGTNVLAVEVCAASGLPS